MSIEVEMRGPLSEERFKELRSFLKNNGEFLGKKNRLSLIYFEGDEIPEDVEEIMNKKIDLKLRITNGEAEIVLKHGEWRSSDEREEYIVQFDSRDFEDAIRILKALGWHMCIVNRKNTYKFKYGGIDFSLTHLPTFGYQFEAEILTEDGDRAEQKKEEILETLDKLDLEVYSEEEFKQLCNRLNNTEEIQYDFYEDSPDGIRKNFGGFFPE
ncbi:MAG: CYTH domain-containing protein [Candidatus Aenigmatarchaeota archaeon]